MAVAQVQDLRRLIAHRFPDALRRTEEWSGPVASGVAAFDGILPGGGFPRGRLTAWAPGGGCEALLRTTCSTTINRGERAAWVEPSTELGPWWVESEGQPMVIRAADALIALRAAEELTRSGAFALVVVVGATPQGTETIRLTRAAHEGGTAVVVLTERAPAAALRLTSQLDLEAYRFLPSVHPEPAAFIEAQVTVHAQGTGWHKSAKLSLLVQQHDLRLSLDPQLADRRGVAR